MSSLVLSSHMKRQRFLLQLCGALDCEMDYFIDSKTGLMKPGFELLVQLRMQEIGIYSWTQLGRELRLDVPGTIHQRIKHYDGQSFDEQKQYARFKQEQQQSVYSQESGESDTQEDRSGTSTS